MSEIMNRDGSPSGPTRSEELGSNSSIITIRPAGADARRIVGVVNPVRPGKAPARRPRRHQLMAVCPAKNAR